MITLLEGWIISNGFHYAWEGKRFYFDHRLDEMTPQDLSESIMTKEKADMILEMYGNPEGFKVTKVRVVLEPCE